MICVSNYAVSFSVWLMNLFTNTESNFGMESLWVRDLEIHAIEMLINLEIVLDNERVLHGQDAFKKPDRHLRTG